MASPEIMVFMCDRHCSIVVVKGAGYGFKKIWVRFLFSPLGTKIFFMLIL